MIWNFLIHWRGKENIGGFRMDEKRYSDSERFVFCRSVTGNMQLVDKLKYFTPIDLSDELAEVLSQILYEHIQFVNEKNKGLFELNNLKDFIKENSDLDNEILIALIKQRGIIYD